MTMDLEEALRVVDGVMVEAQTSGEEYPSAAREAVALGVVLTAARERFAARVVGETNRLTAKALEANRSRSCNLHADCDAAEADAIAEGRDVEHCRSDDCEECFPK